MNNLQTEYNLVSVICTVYNQSLFIEAALLSVENQSINNWELIVIDDASTDDSWEAVQKFPFKFPEKTKLLRNETNIGICASFNRAFKLSKGNWIVDFSGDDVMASDRLQKQLGIVKNLPERFGVAYGYTQQIDENGKILPTIVPDIGKGQHGDLFSTLLSRYLLFSGSMLIRREIIEQLNGYDETLAYEDFDFWIRSSRICSYAFLPEIIHFQRIHKTNFSRKFEAFENSLDQSTYRVLRKAEKLVKNQNEEKALYERIRIELFGALRKRNYYTAKKYGTWLYKLKPSTVSKVFIYIVFTNKVILNPAINASRFFRNIIGAF